MGEKVKRKGGLPDDPEQWKPEHDLLVFRRVEKLLSRVPDQAWPRTQAYLRELIGQMPIEQRRPWSMHAADPQQQAAASKR